jgi:imidazolonepropionase-like amidohydrolase
MLENELFTYHQIFKLYNFQFYYIGVTTKSMIMSNSPFLLLLVFTLFSCQPKEKETEKVIKAFIGATIIDGTGTPMIQNGTMIVTDGKVTDVGFQGDVIIPAGSEVIDVTGKYLMPGLINSHGHIGGTNGLKGGEYSKDNVIRDLALNARYGVTTVVSLGGDEQASLDIRNEQSVSTLNRTRLFVAGTIVTGDTPEAVRSIVQTNASNGVDFIKIRVDDNLGNSIKMTPEIYTAVIDEAHKNNIPVASHLFYLEDAKGLLNAGTDFIAHSIRDQAVDQELIDLIKSKDVYYCPTLMREVSTFVYESTPEFFNDPFFLAETPQSILDELNNPERQQSIQNSASAKAYKAALKVAMDNLKILSDNGVMIIMGTDAGPPARFQGYFEHKELELMVEAGMTPLQVIQSATSNAADYLGLENLGAIKKGNWADFLILNTNPLADISNTKDLNSVYIAGNKVPAKQ